MLVMFSEASINGSRVVMIRYEVHEDLFGSPSIILDPCSTLGSDAR